MVQFRGKWGAALLASCVLLLPVIPARADVCEDVGVLADKWHDLGDYIEEHSDDGGLLKTEIKKVSTDMRALVRPTLEAANTLVKGIKGKNDQRMRALGKQMLGALEELGGLKEDDDWDEDLEIIDRLVLELDKVVELCDAPPKGKA
jgi:hypothetical protein